MTKNVFRFPVRYGLFGGYRRGRWSWWKDLGRWVTQYWWEDLYAFYHRGRYGWAPRDTWSLDTHLDGVLAGVLSYLAETSHGTPSTYPYLSAYVMDKSAHIPRMFDETRDDWDDVICDHDQWKADLRRWAQTFADVLAPYESYPMYHTNDWTAIHQESTRRERAADEVLREMLPWWRSLWS